MNYVDLSDDFRPVGDGGPPAVSGRRLKRTEPGAVARMRFALRWESDGVRHTESYAVDRVDLGRDRLPPLLAGRVIGQPPGHWSFVFAAPGELLPDRDPARVIRVSGGQIDRNFHRGVTLVPRLGRFYPQGILRDVAGITPGSLEPCRVVGLDSGGLTIDLNHPLAGRHSRIEFEIEEVWGGGEAGGRGTDILALLTDSGPGMQARWDAQATDFLSDRALARVDAAPDREFYAEPRMVRHIDRSAGEMIERLYSRLIPREGRVLDLMASWDSHLAAENFGYRVTGLGLNQEELRANRVLADWVVHDLNATPMVPFAAERFDAVVCTVSIEYLIDPVRVMREVRRVLRPGGRFILAFSNRWFPTKAVRIWTELHEFERLGLVAELLREAGGFDGLETWTMRGLPRPHDDPYTGRLRFADPVYAIWGRRSEPH